MKWLKIEDCTFQGQKDSGTALMISNSNAIIYKTNFASNTGLCLFWVHTSAHIILFGGGSIVLHLSNATL